MRGAFFPTVGPVVFPMVLLKHVVVVAYRLLFPDEHGFGEGPFGDVEDKRGEPILVAYDMAYVHLPGVLPTVGGRQRVADDVSHGVLDGCSFWRCSYVHRSSYLFAVLLE